MMEGGVERVEEPGTLRLTTGWMQLLTHTLTAHSGCVLEMARGRSLTLGEIVLPVMYDRRVMGGGFVTIIVVRPEEVTPVDDKGAAP